MKREPQQLFYTIAEIKKFLNCSHGTVRKLIETNALRACKVGGNWRIMISDFEDYLDGLYNKHDNA